MNQIEITEKEFDQKPFKEKTAEYILISIFTFTFVTIFALIFWKVAHYFHFQI